MTNLLIGITGSLSVLSMPSYLLELSYHFPCLKIIMTHSATQFIAKESLGMFAEGIYTSDFPFSKDYIGHVALARWADIFAIIPATAQVLSEAAHGSASTLLTATILAYEKGVVFFPNMNIAMWQKKAVHRNVAMLQEDKHRIIFPIEKPAFEYASKKLEIHPVLPSIESVLSILKLEEELCKC